jgi:hypothetical protein
MQQIAESLPPYDLLKAYRDARVHFRTADIVLVVVPDQLEGFVAQPRDTYVERAFQHWSPAQRAIHPLVQQSAHQRLKLPLDRPAFWLAVESPQDESVGYCAIGAIFRPSLDAVEAAN